jgi:hypothetical protein
MISVKSLLDLESDPAMPTIQICIVHLLLNFAYCCQPCTSNFKMADPFQKEAWWRLYQQLER